MHVETIALMTVVISSGIVAGGMTAGRVEIPDEDVSVNTTIVNASSERSNTPAERAFAANTADSDDRPGEIGPAEGMSDQVTDRAAEVHATIESSIEAVIRGVGQTLGNVLGEGTSETSPTQADRVGT